MKRGALIGCGFFSANHLHAWQQLEGVEIVALCDRDEQRLAQTARTFGISATYRDAAEMITRERLDFVEARMQGLPFGQTKLDHFGAVEHRGVDMAV